MRRNNQNKRKQSNRVVKNNKNAIKKDRRASINLKEDEELEVEIKIDKNGDKKVIGTIKKDKSKKKKNRKKEKKNGPIKKFIKKCLTIILIALIVIGLLFFIKVKKNGGGVKGVLYTILGQSVENKDSFKPINVLLLGISEDISKKLTDTIIVCSYNPKTSNAYMISVPRDTFVGTSEETAKGSEKINSLYSRGGPDKIVKAVENITSMDIDYYAVIDNNAVIEIVDIIGGVTFDIPIDMDYDDPTQDLHIHLNAGVQNVNGSEAEQLLRFRHNNDGTSYPAEYGDNDFGRMKTQRNFIMETLKQTLKIKNIFNAKNIIDTVFENIETDLVVDEVLGYVPTVVDINFDEISNYQLPGESKKCNDLWFFIADKDKTKTLIDDLNK